MPAARDRPLSLPALETFTDDELHFARFSVGVARAGGALFEGRLIECHVARVLGAALPATGTSTWDLRLRDGRTVQVKSGRNVVSLSSSGDADIWIFVHKPATRGEPYRYSVATGREVTRLRRGRTGGTRTRVSLSEVERVLGAVSVGGLRRALGGRAAAPKGGARGRR